MAVYVWYRKAFKERDFKRSWQDQIRPNWSDDGGIDWVSCRNNLTLLEHFTSSTRPGQRSARGGFSFTGLYLRSELCHHSFPTPTPPHATGSVHLWAPQNAFVHCVYFSRSVGRISRKSRLFFFFFHCWGPRPCQTLADMTSCDRRMRVTGNTWWQHFTSVIKLKCLSHYLSFGLLQLNFFLNSGSQHDGQSAGGLWSKYVQE